MIGPWIQTAVLCERVEGGGAGNLAALGVLDGAAVEPGAMLSLKLLIALVRGGRDGPIRLQVIANDPEGLPIAAIDVDGDPPPIAYAISRIVVPIEFVPGRTGVYWFDIRYADDTITRVPLRIDWR